MARKGQVHLQDTVETEEEFEAYIKEHSDKLICMEVYADYCGNCNAMQNAIRKGKLELGGDRIAMVKASSDHIEALCRFKYKSEPVFLFIFKGKLTRVMFGANGIKFCRLIEEELSLAKREVEEGFVREKQEIYEMTSDEAQRIEEDKKLLQEHRDATERLRVLTVAARKQRINQKLSNVVRFHNFIMFWPHCHQAHYDLYEKWDTINVSVAAKETFQLNENSVKEALYLSDVDVNEACLHALLNGEVLIVLFKMFETDTRDFVKVMRYALYEEIPVHKEDTPPEKQVRPVPAYERYATISKTAREVRRERHNVKLQKLQKEKEDAERLAAEQARLEREAEEERERIEKQRQEEERMARIAAGLPPEPEPEPEPEVIPEEIVEEKAQGEDVEKAEAEVTEVFENPEATEAVTDVPVEEPNPPENIQVEENAVEEIQKVASEHVKEEVAFSSDVEIEGEEYIPPGGLFIPGLYTPPNDLAKANALAFFFPKIVGQYASLETEHLPPHVLVMFHIEKRHDVLEIMQQLPHEILNYGIFVGDDPFNVEHVAYTVKQYDKMARTKRHKDRIALVVSRKRSLPLLSLAGLNPTYISSDAEAGERDCLNLFPVGYGDDYVEQESVKEEEVVAEPEHQEGPIVETTEEVVDAEEKEEDEDEDEEPVPEPPEPLEPTEPSEPLETPEP